MEKSDSDIFSVERGWFLCTKDMYMDGICKCIAGRPYAMQRLHFGYFYAKIEGEYGFPVLCKHNDLEEHFSGCPYETMMDYIDHMRICVIDNEAYHATVLRNKEIIRLCKAKNFEYVRDIECNGSLEPVRNMRAWHLLTDAKYGDFLAVWRSWMHRAVGVFCNLHGNGIVFREFSNNFNNTGKSPDGFFRDYVLDISGKDEDIRICPTVQIVKDRYMEHLKDSGFVQDNVENGMDGETGLFKSSDWIMKRDGTGPFRFKSVKIAGSVYTCTDQLGNDVEIRKDEAHAWSLLDIRQFSIVTVHSDDRQKSYICSVSRVSGNEALMLAVLDTHTGKIEYGKKIRISEELCLPSTPEEVKVSQMIRPIFGGTIRCGGSAGCNTGEPELARNGETHVWNKSGKVVRTGDYLLRKSDRAIMQIKAEFKDLFLASTCTVTQPCTLSINKHTDFKKFCLWTPNLVRRGDIVSIENSLLGNTVLVVNAISDDGDDMKFGSEMYIDINGFHLPDGSISWFPACESRPSSCSDFLCLIEHMKEFAKLQQSQTEK